MLHDISEGVDIGLLMQGRALSLDGEIQQVIVLRPQLLLRSEQSPVRIADESIAFGLVKSRVSLLFLDQNILRKFSRPNPLQITSQSDILFLLSEIDLFVEFL